MRWNRRLKSGYSDLGRIQIPPMAQAIVLTDRDTGALWLVAFSPTLPEHLSITSDFSRIQRRDGVVTYPAGEGPAMDEDGQYILMVRNGRIGLDYNLFPTWQKARDGAPPYARTISDKRELILDSIDPLITHLGYET
jgi:hypothetical protein